MANNGLNIKITAPIVMIAVLLVALLVSSGCYNSKTGEVTVGGSISFELPVFPETGSHAVQFFLKCTILLPIGLRKFLGSFHRRALFL